MNSVVELGDYILYLAHSEKAWEGDRESVVHSDNADINDFFFANALMQGYRRDSLRKP
jgi:phospholipid/cholesterol/gamma-HCH transport system ATP-binding protein